MKKIKLFGLLLLLFFLLGCSGGGGTSSNVGGVAGVVLDASNNLLSGATVVCGSVTGKSLSNGSFSLSSITSGAQTLYASLSGYTNSYYQVTVLKGQTITAPPLILQPLDSKVVDIGTGGGDVSNTTGSVKITIPAGTVSSATNFTVTQVELGAAPLPPPTDYRFVAVIVYISPANVSLAKPITLTIPNSTNLAVGTQVNFYHLDTDLLTWNIITSATAEVASNNTISAQITKTGWIAALLPLTLKANLSGYVSNTSTSAKISGAYVWTSSGARTITDSTGLYSFTSLPAVEKLTIEAHAVGYNTVQQSISLESGSSSTLNFSLTPQARATIQGLIYDVNTNVGIPSARVIGPSGIETTTDSSGNYSIVGAAIGTHTIYAYANSYSFNSATVVATNGATVTKNIGLTRTTEATAWEDTFETTTYSWEVYANFSEYTTWQRVDSSIISETLFKDNLAPVYVTLPDYASTLGKLPQPRSGSSKYYYWYGQKNSSDSRGCYIVVSKSGQSVESGGTSSDAYFYNYAYFTSPLIDTRNFAYATLSFWTWWEIEGYNPARSITNTGEIKAYDEMKISVSKDYGNTWTEIAILNPYQDPDVSDKLKAYLPYTSGGFNKTPVWVQHKLDLSSYIGNLIKIRFAFNSRDQSYNGFRGWIIDDVKVDPSRISGSQVSAASCAFPAQQVFKPR